MRDSLDKQQAALKKKLKELVECQQALQALEREKTNLQEIVHQLIQGQYNLSSDVVTCPICCTKFPGRISEHDF